MRKRLLQIILIVFAGLTMLGAGNPANRFDKLGHQLMCTCGCGEILLECNHVGCPVSGPMIDELHTQLASGLANPGVLNWFATKYGPTVLAAPVRGGFDVVAWVVPFAVLALGIGGVVALVRLWHSRHRTAAAMAGVTGFETTAPMRDDVRERIRRETHFDL